MAVTMPGEDRLPPGPRRPFTEVPTEPRLSRDRVRPAPVSRTAGPAAERHGVTGGTRYDLPVEAMISSMPHQGPELTSVYQAIVGLCHDGRSVAEVSALLKVPLGVARVLVADMVNEGLLRLHQSPLTERQPDLPLLERVLGGLRQL